MAGLFALVGGALNEVVGRRPVIILSSFLFLLGAIVMACAQHKETLLIGRLIIGVGLGMASMTSPMYIAEVAPPHLRGQLVAANTAMVTGGQLVACVIAGIFSGDKENGWRYMLGLAGVPAFIQLVCFLFMPESPTWLIVKKDSSQPAERVLEKIRKEQDLNQEMDDLIAYKEALEKEPPTIDKLKIMVSNKATRRALITGCMLQIFQQLCGINTFMYYSASILLSAGVGSADKAIWLAIVPSAANFIFTLVGMSLIEKLGRRRLTMGTQLVAAFGLLCLSLSYVAMETDDPSIAIPRIPPEDSPCFDASTCSSCITKSDCGFCFHEDGGGSFSVSACLPYRKNEDDFSSIGLCSNQSDLTTLDLMWTHEYCPSRYALMTLVSMVLFLAGFATGMGAVPWVVNAEIYPIWGRGVGGGISTTCNWVTNLFLSFTFITLSTAMTPKYFFAMTAGFNILVILYIFLFLPETKGVSLEKVESLFSGPSCFVGLQRSHRNNFETSTGFIDSRSSLVTG
ncbi:proton myo-inositol cotransporter-like isoform X2 [Symsagittifera roscoffensis]